MSNFEYIEYLNKQINKAKQRLIKKFIQDLKEAKVGIGGNDTLVSIKDIYKLITKWEEKVYDV